MLDMQKYPAEIVVEESEVAQLLSSVQSLMRDMQTHPGEVEVVLQSEVDARLLSFVDRKSSCEHHDNRDRGDGSHQSREG